MFTEDKITEIFCIADDFCNFFDAQILFFRNFGFAEVTFTRK